MDIFSEIGTSVIYLGKGGYERNREYAESIGLVIGKEYTIDSINVHNYSSEVTLVEFPNKKFNTVMFENVI